jgi:hypothetical protein
MSKSKILFFIFIIITFFSVFLLVTGSSLLTKALDQNNTIPLGTFITWLGIISLPLTLYFGIKDLRYPYNLLLKILASLLKIILILAVAWVPISYLLAGNISFSFSEKETFQGGQLAMKIFWTLSYGIAIGVVIILFIYWIFLLIRKFKKD